MTLDLASQGTTDLFVLLMDDEPRLIRDGYVSAETARSRGFTATVLEAGAASDASLVERIRSRRARLAAIGTTHRELARTLVLSEQILRDEKLPVLLFGDDLATDLERRKVPVEAATGVVVGDPRLTLADFLAAIGREGMRPVAGLDRLDGDYRPRPTHGTVADDGIPRFFEADLLRLRREGLPIRMSFGCPRRCAHCGIQPREGRYRTRPAHAVVEEIAYHVRENGIRRFDFCDLVLNGDLAQLEAMCDLLLEKKLEVEWWGRAFVENRMERGLYRKMRLAGCIGLDFELPSASDHVLHVIHADYATNHATDALARAAAAGIGTRVSLLVGLPGESETQFGETAAWLDENRFNISQVKDLLPCELLEGSLLHRHHRKYGVTMPEEEPFQSWHNGGFNTPAYRLKRTRELRVFVEDVLQLEIVGRSVEVPWDKELRARVAERVSSESKAAVAQTGRFRQEHLHLAGPLLRGKALAGPLELEIDLTNNCNQHCTGCWIHSFLLGEDRISGELRKATLDRDRVVDLVRAAKRMGTRKVQLSGAGEPYMHPNVDEIVAVVKDEGLELNIITNFTLVDFARAERLVDFGVDTITVSLWAGTAETYAKTHPSAKSDVFGKIVDVVSHLTAYRRRTGCNRPRVKIYNVISALNHDEIDKMIDVAREMGADLIEFTPIDIVKGRTDELELSEAATRRIMDQLLHVRRRPDYLQRTAEEAIEGRVPGLDEQGEFARFLQRHRLPTDFRFSLADIRRWETYCRRGVHCNRVFEKIHRDSSIFFGFPPGECRSCEALVDCSIDPITLTVRAPYLSLQGFGSFWRRVSGEGGEGARDAAIVDKIPCTIGYTYARVQATGHVIPCCKAATFPIGNILEKSFEEIWTSEAYEEFRHKAASLPKSDPYFDPMGCYKVCDNLGHNMITHATLQSLHPACRGALLVK
jgi:radical SAM protein with 4Fe4S-binding SPASM domain